MDRIDLGINLSSVRERIAAACRESGRGVDEVKLIAVSKTHSSAVVREAMRAGISVFGENRVQEAEGKIAELGREGLEWHLIGHLQSNKTRRAVQLFDVIHSVDSEELAERLERICLQEARERLDVLIQVDLAGERSKSGIKVSGLRPLIERLAGFERLRLKGLMVLPPFFDDPEATRPYFRRLCELRDELLPGGELSMGMSHDLCVAIEEGATMVRVGTAIFGERDAVPA